MVVATSTALLVGAGVTAAASIYSANKADENADNAQQSADQRADQAQQNAVQRQGAWESVYGSVESNLANYYNTIDPSVIAAQGMESFEKERTESLARARENLAQRGLSSSGVSADLEISSAMTRGSERAKIRAEAPMKAAQQRMEFLRLGMGSNPDRATQTAFNNQASNAQGQANQAQSTADQAASDAATATTQAVGAAVNAYGTGTESAGMGTEPEEFSYNYDSV